MPIWKWSSCIKTPSWKRSSFVKMDIKLDTKLVTARADFLILANAFATKNIPLVQIFLNTILFVEVISAQKTYSESMNQLLTALKVTKCVFAF